MIANTACDQSAEIGRFKWHPPAIRFQMGVRTVLPFADCIFRREPMFDEEQFSVRLENPPHFDKRCRHVWNTAKRPRHHNRIDAGVVDGN